MAKRSADILVRRLKPPLINTPFQLPADEALKKAFALLAFRVSCPDSFDRTLASFNNPIP
jgi:hypothetical protein